ncbi:cation:proton antiporter [Alkalihalobacillus sp. LMS39]|uniref:cation:proton antiporter domain-containing protein n=1 Tax=Alkalihalobacillus sp. LMS39 TaxID=2924032 RepID=UPI001FB28669|nr:cation:proton antiporter [Alkalihalobacillus sp. LMS39]UOE93136.1 cation:proton antiporter [Alkalihalobacillus sp. LMS39]
MIDQPITNPVLIFAIAMVIFLIAPIIMVRLKLPGIIGLILAGVVIGPNGIGLLDRDPTIVLLGTVGLLYIIFIAGLEIDLEGFRKYRRRSIIFGSLSFFIPCILGTGLGFALGYSVEASLLLGSLLGSHTLLAYPIASRLGISKNQAVTTTVGGTIMTDTFALLFLAVIASSLQGDLSPIFWVQMLGSLSVYVLLVLVIIPRLAKLFFRNISEGSTEFIFVMAILFVTAFFATVVGLEPIIGAFLAGLCLNRYILEQSPLMNRIKFVGNALFIPFFLLSVGMLMDIEVLLQQPEAWILAAGIVVFVQFGKYMAAWISGKMNGYSKEEIKLMFGLSVPQAVATLAATLVGFELGLFNSATVNAVIVMILITCIVGPYMVEKYSRTISIAEEQKPYKPNQLQERILIPLANPKTMESLLDLAFVLRGQSQEPLYPLTVVQKGNGTSESKVAEAEKMLGHAVTYAAGAQIPIQLLTRVDQNISRGVVRAIEETRISTIIIGWNGKLSTPQMIFGGILDQLLERTNEMVLVSKLGHPLNTTKRIIVVLPPGVNHKAGFFEAIRKIKTIAFGIGASVYAFVMKDTTDQYETVFQEIKPDVTSKFVSMKTWSELLENVLLMLKNDDLVIVVSARRGTIAWHPQLERLPRELSKAVPESFIMIYPQETEEYDMRGARGTAVPRTYLPYGQYED